MHPLFGHSRRLALYFAVWIPLGALLAYLLAAAAAWSAGLALALAAPLALLYALVCLPVWYTCRVFPLARRNPGPVFGAHLAAALVAGGLWTAIAQVFVRAYALWPPWRAAALRLAPALPVLWATGILLYLLTVAGYYLWIGAEATRDAERRALEAATLAREAELRALKAQINPHFLFNSLNSISALTTSDPARARRMCVLLADFLRLTLGLGEAHAIPVAEELSLVRAFLAIEQVRFGARLRIEERIEDAVLALPIVPLLLQPLVENAIVHGIAPLVEGGCIRIAAAAADGTLTLSVDNDVENDVENDIEPGAAARRNGYGGLGLANVRGRLRARYGVRARLDAAAVGGRFHAVLTLPLPPPPEEVP